MWGFETTVQKILSGAVIYIVVISSGIFIHWMWFSENDLVIGRQHKKNGLKPGETVMLRGLALPSAYYEKHKKKEEESKAAPSVIA